MCVFCRIIEGELPASVVHEDEIVLAFLDIHPITPGHVLVIPKFHAESLVDLPEHDARHMMYVGQMVDKALRASSFQCEGVNLFLADGRAAGQEVDHVHLHVFPRFSGDGYKQHLIPKLGGQVPRRVLDEQATALRSVL